MADEYQVTAQAFINQRDPGTGEVVPGTEIKVRDLATGVVIPVFVPQHAYTVDSARERIVAAVANARAIHSLTE